MALAHLLLSCSPPPRAAAAEGIPVRLLPPGRRHGEAEQRGQAAAAAALQGRPVRHPLGLHSSRDLPGLVSEEAEGSRGGRGRDYGFVFFWGGWGWRLEKEPRLSSPLRHIPGEAAGSGAGVLVGWGAGGRGHRCTRPLFRIVLGFDGPVLVEAALSLSGA